MKHNELRFNSRRSPVLGTRGMVATSQPLAAGAGISILAQGGNAADAAVATAAALAVTEPTSTGIGGDCFALFYQADHQDVIALNGSGRAPGSLSLEDLRQQGFTDELPPFHAHTVTVPGACAGWCDLVEQKGRLSMAEVLAPAIQLAEEGFPVAPITAHFWDRGVERQLCRAPGGEALTIEGRAPRPGEIFQNPGYVRTLQAVAEGGKQAFYTGEIAQAIVEVVQGAGGVLDEMDLAHHHSTWDPPIATTYRGVKIWECPPNGQGLTALVALNILEGYDLHALDPLGEVRLHLIIEALHLAFADAFQYIADPEKCDIPVQSLLDKSYATQRRQLINPQQANPKPTYGHPRSNSDTVYLTVVDGEGNACSFINSNYMGFGTGMVPKGWGFPLQNRGHNFSLDPNHPNALAPNKRPYHTIIPAMATNQDGSLHASFGVMGGFMQPQGHVQVITALLDDGLDPQAALDRPRICLDLERESRPIAVEMGIPQQTLEHLQTMGHQVWRVEGHERAIFGRGQIILRDPHSGVLWGGCDPRSDGSAIALV